jgi:hypothetical protein
MDQKTPLYDEKSVRFAYFACLNPAIYRFTVTANHFRELRNSQVFALRLSGFFLLIHDPLSLCSEAHFGRR